MASSQEKMKILTLVEQGKITPEEGIRLLNALDRAQAARPVTAPVVRTAVSVGGPRWLRVRVTDTTSNRVRVNVRLPVTVINAGMKLGAHLSPEIGQAEMSQIMQAIQSGTTGQIVDVFSDEDREHIEVLLE
jgi:urease accessory protein UreF